MKNTRFENFRRNGLPREQLLQRLHAVIREELTQRQRETVIAYYFENRLLKDIAAEQGISISTASRTLKRAENNLRRFLQY